MFKNSLFGRSTYLRLARNEGTDPNSSPMLGFGFSYNYTVWGGMDLCSSPYIAHYNSFPFLHSKLTKAQCALSDEKKSSSTSGAITGSMLGPAFCAGPIMKHNTIGFRV